MPTISPTGGAAEPRAEQQRELHVAHPHPARVGERRDEQEGGRADARRSPTRGDGSTSGRAASTKAAAGQHDPVRDHAPLEVGHGDGDEDGAEEGGDERVGVSAEVEDAAETSSAVVELDERVVDRDPDAAARGSVRAGGGTRATGMLSYHGDLVPQLMQPSRATIESRSGDPRRDDVQEAADREARGTNASAGHSGSQVNRASEGSTERRGLVLRRLVGTAAPSRLVLAGLRLGRSSTARPPGPSRRGSSAIRKSCAFGAASSPSRGRRARRSRARSAPA